MTYLDGLIYAEKKGYIVDEYDSPLKSFSISVDGISSIALNHELLEDGEEKTALFHELGHCETGSFYNQYAACDVRQKHENRADKWAIRTLIPVEELTAAVNSGLTQPWELAEHFGVTEPLIRKAICLYTYGDLNPAAHFGNC